MKRKYFIISTAVFAILVFVVYRFFLASEKVDVLKIRRGKLVTVVYATGRVTADEIAVLRCEAGGSVVKLNAREGDRIAKGSLLLQTDQKDALLKINQAENEIAAVEVDLADKQKDLNRLKNLLEGKSVTQKEFDAAKRDVDITKISLERRRILLNQEKENLNKHNVCAPFDCVIYSRTVNLGDYLTPNTECFKIYSPSSILVEADVDEQDLARVTLKGRALVAFDAYPDQKFSCSVSRIIPKTDEATKTSRILLNMDSAPKNLNIGMTATLNIISGEKSGILILPRTAIIARNNKYFVFKAIDGRAKETEVTVGLNQGSYAEITSGIAEGDIVVSEPKASPKDDIKIKY